MSDSHNVLGRCRRLGFPVFIKTEKRISDLDPVTLLWLFYYLLEIYEPSWSYAPTAFTKKQYKPLSNSMRLLELAHKCPKSKELKRPSEHKKSLQSSLSAILDKLEAKYGAAKLYSTRFQHPSIKNMKQARAKTKPNKATTATQSIPVAESEQAQQKQIPIPRATSKDILTVYESKQAETEETQSMPVEKASNAQSMPVAESEQAQQKQIPIPRATSKDILTVYESKQAETEEHSPSNRQYHHTKPHSEQESGHTEMHNKGDGEDNATENAHSQRAVHDDHDGDNEDDVQMVDNSTNAEAVSMMNDNGHSQQQEKRDVLASSSASNANAFLRGDANKHANQEYGMRQQYEQCDLKAYNFKASRYRNETVRFHVKIQENEENMSMTQRYEELQQKQTEKMKNIHGMKQEYQQIAKQLERGYSFHCKPFQDTSSSDYALFQLQSIQQKLKSKQKLKQQQHQSAEKMEQDGIDNLLNSLSNQVQKWDGHD
eukprot:CAMPEP_0197075020 /NCGR_PEP_ID=MMETSP1384-20130603/211400_1 /TAXON_ID=29189 /ORGANISM="Ammonia sp." /LENGTH=486 /DNA_ID=CAMNT_0042513863 /DNA_START=28 /DNA_END=1488 /DNA_ORIENTATION=+